MKDVDYRSEMKMNDKLQVVGDVSHLDQRRALLKDIQVMRDSQYYNLSESVELLSDELRLGQNSNADWILLDLKLEERRWYCCSVRKCFERQCLLAG